MLEELRDRIHKVPFEPFLVVTASGDKYAVDDVGLIALGASQLTIYPPASDRWIVVRLNQITALESAAKVV